MASAIEEGSWSDDDVVTAYLGGAIAASVASEGGSDTSLPWVKLVNRLTADSLAAHHAIYERIHSDRESIATELNLGLEDVVYRELQLYVPARCLSLLGDHGRLVAALRLLSEEGLVKGWRTGRPADLKKGFQVDVDEDGLVVQASIAGLTLYMVGYGQPAHVDPRSFRTCDTFGPMTTEDTESLPTFICGTLVSRN